MNQFKRGDIDRATSSRISGASHYGNVSMLSPTADYYFRPYFLFG